MLECQGKAAFQDISKYMFVFYGIHLLKAGMSSMMGEMA